MPEIDTGRLSNIHKTDLGLWDLGRNKRSLPSTRYAQKPDRRDERQGYEEVFSSHT